MGVQVGKHLNNFAMDAKHVQWIYLAWAVFFFFVLRGVNTHMVTILNVM